jgi:hypothetical protein
MSSENQTDFMGKGGFIWWTGVVEDVNDPLKIGRLKVRILGFHTEDKTLLSTDSLPWASVLQPITSAATSGIGTSPTGIVSGAWVMGFFRDGWNAQDPVVMGSFAGIPQNLPNTNEGFNDPNGNYPTLDYIGESDVNRLARGEFTVYTVVDAKRQNRVQGVRTALGGAWSEPGTPYRAAYPMNSVTETRAGHIIELDDTSLAPRIHIYHKSGSFLEMHPDGSVVDKVVGDDYEIDLRNKKIIIKGNATETVDGTKRELVGGNFAVEVIGNLTTLVHGDHYVETKGNYYHKVGGTYTVVSSGKALQIAPRIDFNPPDFEPSDFPSMNQIKDATPTTEPKVSTRGNDPESNPPQTSNLQSVQKFDTQVAVLEKQKATERKANNSPAAVAARESQNPTIPSPSSSKVGGAAAKVNTTISNGTPTTASGTTPSYLLPSRKKDCAVYCQEVIKNTGGSELDYQNCLTECEEYNKVIDTKEASKVGRNADCDLLDGLDIGGILDPVNQAIQSAISGVGEVVTGIGNAIFGTSEERYCKDELEQRAETEYNNLIKIIGSKPTVNGKPASLSEFTDYYINEPTDTGKTRLEECIEWCKNNPDEFAEIMRERDGDPVPGIPSLSDLGEILDLNISIPGLPSIPCLGIGIASLAGLAAGVGAGIAVARSANGGSALGVAAGVATGVVVGSAVSTLISPEVPTTEAPAVDPIDKVGDAGIF